MWRFGCSMARTATIGGCIALSAHAYSAYRPSPCYALPANTRRNASAAAATAARANEPTDTVSQKEFQKMRKELAAAKKKLATYEKDKVEKPKRGANPQPNEPQPDPMDTDMDGLAAQAGAKSPGKLKERMFSTPTLEDVDVQILATPVPDKDLAIDQMRAHTQRRVADLIQNNPLLQQKQGDIMSFAAAQHREAVLDELNMRGARLNAKVKKQVRKIIEGKPAAADSPNKIKDAAQSLFTAQKNTSAATASMDSILRSALEQLSSSDPEKSALEMLNDLLMSHKQAKRTRATKQCFIQHISSARNHLMNGIAAARAQGDHKLAFELLVAFRHLESQIKRFCDLTDKVGFEAARDHFTNRGNPLNGMTDQMWEVITAMAGNDEHAAIFAKLINGKHIALPEAPANTTADSSGDEEAGGARKRRKGGLSCITASPTLHVLWPGHTLPGHMQEMAG